MYIKTDIPPVLNAWGGDTNPAIFVVAHQDDETLTFGAEIEYHKAAGRYVIVVLATDGRSSSTRGETGLSVKDFVQARNLEFLSACADLGVDEVHLLGGMDGSLSQNMADHLASFYYLRYPTASYKVHDDNDDHPDHKAIGAAFRKIKNNYGSAADIRFYVKPEQRSQYTTLNTTTGGAKTIAAAQEYKYVDQANGRYGIGYLSVPADFDATIASPKATWHL